MKINLALVQTSTSKHRGCNMQHLF